MYRLKIDDSAFVKSMSELEKRQLPFATMLALNDSMFDVYDGWGRAVAQELDRPTPFTRSSIRYKKATLQKLEAFVFVREEAHKGTPPVKYLQPQVRAGARRPKPVENLLRRAGVLTEGEFIVPTRLAPLDQYGNVPASIIKTMLADLQASSNVDARSTPDTRRRRARRKAFSKRAVYFYSRGPGSPIRGEKLQHLPRGIYQRTRFSSGSAIRMIFVIVEGAPTYQTRFDAFVLAQRIFDESFPRRFPERMSFALRTAKIR